MSEPQPEEIIELEQYYGKDNHLAIRHRCPNCGGPNTAWIRQEWSVCFDCLVAFTLADIQLVYDKDAYSRDYRPPAELLEEMYEQEEG